MVMKIDKFIVRCVRVLLFILISPTFCYQSKLKTLYLTVADQANNMGGGSAQNDGWRFHSGRRSGPDGSWDYQWSSGSDRDGNTFGYGSGSSQPGQQGGGAFGYGWSGSTSAGGSSGSASASGSGSTSAGGSSGSGSDSGSGSSSGSFGYGGGGDGAPSGQPTFVFPCIDNYWFPFPCIDNLWGFLRNRNM